MLELSYKKLEEKKQRLGSLVHAKAIAQGLLGDITVVDLLTLQVYTSEGKVMRHANTLRRLKYHSKDKQEKLIMSCLFYSILYRSL